MRAMAIFTLAGIILFVIFMYFRLGGYKSVEFQEATAGPFLLVGKNHLGPYHEIAKVIEEVEAKAKAMGVPCEKTFGYFFDDPDVVDEDRLRSQGGCLWPNDRPVPSEFVSAEVPAKKFLRGRFDGAPSIGPMKVYPAAKDYFSKHGWAFSSKAIEVYTIVSPHEVLTEYYFEIP